MSSLESPGGPPHAAPHPPTRDTSRVVAALLDHCIRIPGTNIRFGLDPLIGLIPGAGDFVASSLGMVILGDAVRSGAPASVVARMGGNVLINHVVGLIPVAGDLFSFWFRSNERNYALLSRWKSGDAVRLRRSSRFVVILILAGLFAALAGLLVLGFTIAGYVFREMREFLGG